jgi:murein L,D-transpeptidase YcbB/YkuD
VVAWSLFGRPERGCSSGCVRVEHPVELAVVLLRAHDDWTPERIRAAMAGNAEQTVVLREKVPVHLLYWTAWMEAGTLHFRDDVYQRDGAVAAALAAPPRPSAAGE